MADEKKDDAQDHAALVKAALCEMTRFKVAIFTADGTPTGDARVEYDQSITTKQSVFDIQIGDTPVGQVKGSPEAK